MGITLVLKLAGIGLVVAVAALILQKNGRDEQSTFIIIAGVVIAALMLVNEISSLFSAIRSAFGI